MFAKHYYKISILLFLLFSVAIIVIVRFVKYSTYKIDDADAIGSIRDLSYEGSFLPIRYIREYNSEEVLLFNLVDNEFILFDKSSNSLSKGEKIEVPDECKLVDFIWMGDHYYGACIDLDSEDGGGILLVYDGSQLGEATLIDRYQIPFIEPFNLADPRILGDGEVKCLGGISCPEYKSDNTIIIGGSLWKLDSLSGIGSVLSKQMVLETESEFEEFIQGKYYATFEQDYSNGLFYTRDIGNDSTSVPYGNDTVKIYHSELGNLEFMKIYGQGYRDGKFLFDRPLAVTKSYLVSGFDYISDNDSGDSEVLYQLVKSDINGMHKNSKIIKLDFLYGVFSDGDKVYILVADGDRVKVEKF